MSEARWDLVVQVVHGAADDGSPKVLRGPRVVVGGSPGPGGFRLVGARGVAPRHAELTALGALEAYITPVGSHPVRFSPTEDVRWEDLEPVSRRVRLTRGAVVHLGPVGGGRGVTLRFVECRDLGTRVTERLSSERHDVAVDAPDDTAAQAGIRAQLRAPDGGIPAKVQRVAVTRLGERRLSTTGLLAALLGGGAVVLLVMAAVVFAVRRGTTVQDLSTEQIEDFAVDLTSEPPAPAVKNLRDVYAAFVLEPNRKAIEAVAGLNSARGVAAVDPAQPEAWDNRLYAAVVNQLGQLAKSRPSGRAFTEVLERSADPYATVLQALREEQLPEVLAAIPYVETRYNPKAVSPLCAAGPWQFMPEWGYYLPEKRGMGESFRVADCVRRSGGERWSPTQAAPPLGVSDNAPYVVGGRCDLHRCQVDFRPRWDLSTAAATVSFRDTLTDPDIGRSGAAVQIAIAAHHAGYDDAGKTGGRPKRHNLDVAYRRWLADKPDRVDPAHFYGDAMRCPNDDDYTEGCEAYLFQKTQRYAVLTLAVHLGAVCYYGRHHADKPAFTPYRDYARLPYCDTFLGETP